MPSLINCPACGKGYQIAESNIGRTAKCPCGRRFVLSKPDGASSPPARKSPPAEPPPSENPYVAPSYVPTRQRARGRSAAAEEDESRVVIDVAHIFAATHRIFAGKPFAAIAVVFGFALVSSGLNFLQTAGGGWYGEVGVVVIYVVISVVNIWLSVVEMLMLLNIARGNRAWTSQKTLPYVPRIIGLILLVGLAVGIIATVAIGVPAFLCGLIMGRHALGIAVVIIAIIATITILAYLALVYSQSAYLIIDRNLGVLTALKSSQHLTRGNRGQILLISLLQIALMLPGVAILGLGAALGELLLVFALVGLLYYLYALPVIMLMTTATYLSITGQLDGRPSD